MNSLNTFVNILSLRNTTETLSIGKVYHDELSTKVYADVLDVSGISLVPVTSLPSEVQYFFNVTPYAMIKEGGITIDKHEEE